jgi:hypothetical protein
MVISINSEANANAKAAQPISNRHRMTLVISCLFLFSYLIFSFLLESEAETTEIEQIKGVDFKKEALPLSGDTLEEVMGATKMPDSSSAADSSNNGECNLDCDALNSKRIYEFGGDLMDRTVLLQLATQAREKVIENIKKDYGIYFEDIFKNGFEPITHDGDSIQMLTRKLKIKALTVQSNVLKEKEICDQECRLLEHDASSPIYNSTIPHYTRYVWATGGHSASAGHGNLFNESYTAFMERDIKPIFAAVGIEFEGRNYDMGGTKSGLEISMCFDQVFGSDVDFFSWDYGMIDGRKDSLLFHYGYRGASNPGRPAILGVWTCGWKGRSDRLRDVESLGVVAFHRPKENTKCIMPFQIQAIRLRKN